MPATKIRCPDGTETPIQECLSSCKSRCLTLPTLLAITAERVWTGVPSTTQLLNGTMMEFLKLTKPYTIAPQGRAFSLLGTRHHQRLEEIAKELGLPAEKALTTGDRDIIDLLEREDDTWILTDYKTWGSFKVAKALGITEVGKEPTGEVYKSSGKWGKAGSPKMRPVFAIIPENADLWDSELQLNRYRIKLKEQWGVEVGKMQLQITVRDGGLAIARQRGVDRNIYKTGSEDIPALRRLEDEEVKKYFYEKTVDLLACLNSGFPPAVPCDGRESWDGVRCKGYCDVAHHCPRGQTLLREKEAQSEIQGR